MPGQFKKLMDLSEDIVGGNRKLGDMISTSLDNVNHLDTIFVLRLATLA